MGRLRPKFNSKGRQNQSSTSYKENFIQEDISEFIQDESLKELNQPSATMPKEYFEKHLEVVPEQINSKKRKRLEKYIEKKLKKEERLEIVQKLSQSSIAGNPLFRSSKQIGQPQSLKQKLHEALIKEKMGISVDLKNVLLYQPMSSDSETEDDEVEKENEVVEVSGKVENVKSEVPVIVGSALKKKPKLNLKKEEKKTQMTITEEPSSDSEPEEIVQEEMVKEPNIKAEGKVDLKPEILPVNEKPTPCDNIKEETPSKPAFYVLVKRSPEIQEQRLSLPILAEEHTIMENIKENDVFILCGETGSGKTTQLPQFLYESGFSHPGGPFPGKIGITQPRRVAAISIAKRVAVELGLSESEVAYQIRYEGTQSAETKIKFMTDGVLLKELSIDFLLLDYSVIVIDEAHERSLNTDILIGMLSRIVTLRQTLSKESHQRTINGKQVTIRPLKLIIMSATLRVQDFIENKVLFLNTPPLIEIPGRQFPVSIHFNKKTPENDFVAAAFKKVCKIHKRLPAGGILVFLPGQTEILDLCKRLQKKFPSQKNQQNFNRILPKKSTKENEKDFWAEEDRMETKEDMELEDDSEEETDEEMNEDSDDDFDEPLYVLPLYSLLSPQEQMKVFQEPPNGTRMCIVATNVAETSITIPNIRYVVDSGLVKEKTFDFQTGVSKFQVHWASKASAEQRAGRAARTGPGHCYRLYSSAVFGHLFPEFSAPEIQRMPIEGVVLQMKSMNIDQVVHFPFPTPPERSTLAAAERLLVLLGALEMETKKITKVGQLMAHFPIHPRLAKMLIFSLEAEEYKDIVPYVICLVAALSVEDPFIRQSDSIQESEDDDEEEEKSTVNKVIYMFSQQLNSDSLTLIRVVGAFEYAKNQEEFCKENHLRFKIMTEIRQLRQQLFKLIPQYFPNVQLDRNLKLKPFNAQQIIKIKEVLLSGYLDQVAIKLPKQPYEKLTPYVPLFKSNQNVSSIVPLFKELTKKLTPSSPLFKLIQKSNPESFVYIHPSSSLSRQLPQYVFYKELVLTKKCWMKQVTALESLQKLASLASFI